MWTSALELIGGLALLIYAADWVVNGAVSLSRRFNISPTTLGLTVVAYGTSLPEMVVSVLAARRGVADFALGNVVGSNIANIALVLGATAILAPIVYGNLKGFARDFTFLALATGSMAHFLRDSKLSAGEGIILLGIAAFFTYASIRQGLDEDGAEDGEEDGDERSAGHAFGLTLLGLIGLTIGADFMVDGATDIARTLGIDERIIGLSVVAVGTSLPELAASVAAARKGAAGLAVGNIMGSCLFNVTFVLGSASVIHEMTIDLAAMRVDLSVLAIVTVSFWAFLGGGRTLGRGRGLALLLLYGVYIGYLAMDVL